MIIDENGEIISIDEEDFKRAIKNPYAEKIHRSRTFFLDETIIKRFDELAKENGTYRDEFIERVLLNYLSQAEKQNITTTSN